jgi:hypothetical protein
VDVDVDVYVYVDVDVDVNGFIASVVPSPAPALR